MHGPDGPLSRRQLFPALAGAVSLAAAFSVPRSERAQAQSKTDQKTAKYQGHPTTGKVARRATISARRNPASSLTATSRRNGWCSFFAKKA